VAAPAGPFTVIFTAVLPASLSDPERTPVFFVEGQASGQVLGREGERLFAGGRDEEEEMPARRGTDDAG